MTGVNRSGRWSARSVSQPHAAPGAPRVRRSSAPESLTRISGEPSAAERGGRQAVSKVSDQQLRRLHQQLSARDRAILQTLSTYKFATTSQLRDLHFHDHASSSASARICRRVLQRLRERDVIEELDRRVGGVLAGSDAFIWRVGKLGDRLLRLEAGDGARARRKEPSERFLQHCLDILSAYLQLLQAHRSGTLELLATSTEPASWRPYLGPSGERLTLKPDLLATTAALDFEDSWALEIDRGTESIPTLLRKCAQYEAYRATGREQAEHDVFPLVVWIVPTERRAERLSSAIDHATRLDRTLYRICTPSRLLAVIAGGAS